MSRTTHVCDGCGAELRSKRDLEKEGAVHESWNCAYCSTSVPGIVAERIRHQRQHGSNPERGT